MAEFLDLQNGWYNGFLQGMGQSENSFQIIQPAPPLAEGTAINSLFWTYFNNIPPDSLTLQFVASGGNQFYNNYRGLLSALVPARNVDVKKDIGAENFKAWQTYVLSRPLPPNMNELPTLFRNWAMIYDPSIANIGSSDYAAILLDPIATAQNELTLVFTDLNGLPKDFTWMFTYQDMVNQLKNAPSRAFTFDSSTMNSNVSNSWTGGKVSGFFGLWGGSASTSSISKKFAGSKVHVNANFQNVQVFSNTPGVWYYSSAMALAYANQTGNPWSPDSSINWNNTFGTNGNLQRFASNLVIASGMSVTVVSEATYSEEEQTSIQASGSAGFWPFYSGSVGTSSTNVANFDQNGRMTITTSSAPGVPIVLGANVLPVSEFVGHSSQSAMAQYKHAQMFTK